ncbi:hypothetical protein KIN20_035714 [Parelaphostrongylus tenuis]|uniref:Uncharacterized protein n=1 Tax=Parelaphostrongylus tenuis TaxID=148309 RepID=A0AAD5RC64_PARTN|nr:hypothetical protein KIN20_035714 [Parelaphostrongylus tenuis]
MNLSDDFDYRSTHEASRKGEGREGGSERSRLKYCYSIGISFATSTETLGKNVDSDATENCVHADILVMLPGTDTHGKLKTQSEKRTNRERRIYSLTMLDQRSFMQTVLHIWTQRTRRALQSNEADLSLNLTSFLPVPDNAQHDLPHLPVTESGSMTLFPHRDDYLSTGPNHSWFVSTICTGRLEWSSGYWIIN